MQRKGVAFYAVLFGLIPSSRLGQVHVVHRIALAMFKSIIARKLVGRNPRRAAWL